MDRNWESGVGGSDAGDDGKMKNRRESRWRNSMCEVGGVKGQEAVGGNDSYVLGGMEEAVQEKIKKAIWAKLERARARILKTQGNECGGFRH